MRDPDWLKRLFGKIDGKDAKGFTTFLSDDATFRLGNGDAVSGKAVIESAVKGFFDSIRGLRHELLESWETTDAVICRGTVTYIRHDGSELTVPFAAIFKMRGDLIRDYLVYIDQSALYAAPATLPFG